MNIISVICEQIEIFYWKCGLIFKKVQIYIYSRKENYAGPLNLGSCVFLRFHQISCRTYQLVLLPRDYFKWEPSARLSVIPPWHTACFKGMVISYYVTSAGCGIRSRREGSLNTYIRVRNTIIESNTSIYI